MQSFGTISKVIDLTWHNLMIVVHGSICQLSWLNNFGS